MRSSLGIPSGPQDVFESRGSTVEISLLKFKFETISIHLMLKPQDVISIAPSGV